jgi:hypothetical protein
MYPPPHTHIGGVICRKDVSYVVKICHM